MELYFTDGSCPEDDIIEDFLQAVENEKGAIAVHCKVIIQPITKPLGRSGQNWIPYCLLRYEAL